MGTESYNENRIKSTEKLLIFVDDRVKSVDLSFRQKWSIGRKKADCSPDIALSELHVSGEQAVLSLENGRWYITNISAKNRTILNGTSLNPNEKKVLSEGDLLRIDSPNASEIHDVLMIYTSSLSGNNWYYKELLDNSLIRIGHSEKCDIRFSEGYISEHHADIVKKDAKIMLVDQKSKTGVYLNQKKVQKSVQVKNKDQISICDHIIIVMGNRLIYNLNEFHKDISYAESSVYPSENSILSAMIKKKNVNGRDLPIIENVSLEIKEGSLVAILGSSGAGKSTLMDCLNGMNTVGLEGDVFYKGESLIENFQRLKYCIGSVPQKSVVNEMLTVREELTFAAKLRTELNKCEIDNKVDAVLNELNIYKKADDIISSCSGGEKQRVNMAIELVADRNILCLDEPDAGLDPLTKKNLFLTLRNMAHSKGTSILVIIHDVSDINLFDQVIIMTKSMKKNSKGELLAVGHLAFSGSPQSACDTFRVTDFREIYNKI